MGCLLSRPSPAMELSHKEPNSAEPIMLRLSTGYICKHGSFRKDYEVLRVISPSEHRRVLEVKNKVTQEVFMLKEVTKAQTSSQEAGSLLKEVEVLSRLSHPNLIKMQELYEDKHKFYIIGELMHGGELYDFIADSESLTESIAANIMRQLLSAVAYCHANSVVLRNIKPENILLTSRPATPEQIQVKLVDFGSSTMNSNHRHLHKVIGTELYTAPEVFVGDYTEACDVWSLGCILYVMLSGQLPFSGETSEEIQAQVKRGEYELSGPKWDNVSSDAKDLIRGMISVDISLRFTAQQALNHIWITSAREVSVSDHEKGRALVTDLKKFQGEKKLKQALSGFITDRFLSKEHIEEQRQAFQALDKDSNGTLTREELIDALSSTMSREDATAEVDGILTNIDCDGSKAIDYKEFLSAAAVQKNLLSKQMIEKAFAYLDADQNGKLSVKELYALLGNGMEKAELKTLINQADKNGDGQLDLKEFTSLILQE